MGGGRLHSELGMRSPNSFAACSGRELGSGAGRVTLSAGTRRHRHYAMVSAFDAGPTHRRNRGMMWLGDALGAHVVQAWLQCTSRPAQ